MSVDRKAVRHTRACRVYYALAQRARRSAHLGPRAGGCSWLLEYTRGAGVRPTHVDTYARARACARVLLPAPGATRRRCRRRGTQRGAAGGSSRGLRRCSCPPPRRPPLSPYLRANRRGVV
eukprot:6195665-Pleurochrysis_carterae.AAC.3